MCKHHIGKSKICVNITLSIVGKLEYVMSTSLIGSPKITELSCTSSLFLLFLVGESNTVLFNKKHNF